MGTPTNFLTKATTLVGLMDGLALAWGQQLHEGMSLPIHQFQLASVAVVLQLFTALLSKAWLD